MIRKTTPFIQHEVLDSARKKKNIRMSIETDNLVERSYDSIDLNNSRSSSVEKTSGNIEHNNQSSFL